MSSSIKLEHRPDGWYWLQHGEVYGPYATRLQAKLNAIQSQEK